MPKEKISYSGMGLYRLDFLLLLLCMAVGHIVIGNPFFGAAVYLFADIIKSYYFCNIGKLRHSGGEQYLSKIVLSLVFIGGLAVAFLYPLLQNVPSANYVSLFVLCLILRDFLSSSPVLPQSGRRGLKYYVSTLLVHCCFDLCCIYLMMGRVDGVRLYAVIAAVVLTGILKLFFPEKHLPSGTAALENRYESIASYRLFSDMNLYATIALNLGIMAFLLNTIIPMGQDFDGREYLRILAWIFVMYIVIVISFFLTKKRWNMLALGEFIIGALMWLVGTVFMPRFHTGDLWLVLTCIWGLGIALISSAVRKFYLDFEAVGRLLGEGYDKEELEISNTMVSTAASILSSAVMLILMAVWTFVIPLFHDGNLPAVFTFSIMQLPVIFMLIAIVLALRHPLDFRNREKLIRYMDEHSASEETKENLRRLFVSKYRMRFGIKIVCTLARPFLRLKVSGMENLRKEESPSVFVCNHGFIYGPISAVIYLPTYFRPWIHNVMLDRSSARKELGKSLRIVTRIFGKKIGGSILDGLTRLTCWALNSFNPIPVVRGASRDVMSTFNESLKALEEGDNILIFPEKPKNLVGLPEDADAYRLRSFYTGFAHVGKMYYDKTGRSLLFYPLYSDKDRRVFRIGEPVRYDANLEPHESKKAVAEQLQTRMEQLAGKS